MKVVISGATGFIGSLLREQLRNRSHSLTLLSRQPPRAGTPSNEQWLVWQPGSIGPWEKSVDGADGIINLAGEPIAGKRWTEAQKEKIRMSRIDSTRALVNAIGRAKEKPKFMISASAVGYYGPRGDETLIEESAAGNDFLGRVCVSWEQEAKKAEAYGVRVALLRTGIVLGKGKGALAKMVTPFKLFAGGPLGSGKQWFPWIHIEDELGLILFLAENPEAKGPFNATAPNAVTMEEFCQALGTVLNRPSWASAPTSVLTLLLGEMADMVVNGQRAVPAAAQKLGYRFKYVNVVEALQSLRL
jgi:uncharacterized protein (TIGR01777 family)